MESRVVDSRLVTGGTVTWRRRECDACKAALHDLRTSRTQPANGGQKGWKARTFKREKVLASLKIACNKLPVSADALEETADVAGTRTFRERRA